MTILFKLGLIWKIFKGIYLLLRNSQYFGFPI
jgi:hypothetical protein